MIGDDLQSAPRPENPLHLLDEWLLDEPALVMPLLGPRVGKVNVNDREAVIGNVLADEEHRLGANCAGIEQMMPAQSIACVSPIPACPFDAEEIGVRSRSRLLGQESPLPHSDFHFDG